MYGPIALTSEELDYAIFDKYGVYLLADNSSVGYKIKYVGRGHLKTRLRQRIGKYNYFYYEHANHEFTRFRRECEEFHRYGKANQLDNKVHPAKPPGYDTPLCTQRGCNGESV